MPLAAAAKCTSLRARAVDFLDARKAICTLLAEFFTPLNPVTHLHAESQDMPLRVKLAISFLLIGLIPVLAMTVTVYRQASQAL